MIMGRLLTTFALIPADYFVHVTAVFLAFFLNSTFHWMISTNMRTQSFLFLTFQIA